MVYWKSPPKGWKEVLIRTQEYVNHKKEKEEYKIKKLENIIIIIRRNNDKNDKDDNNKKK